jgi:hypothetical protein
MSPYGSEIARVAQVAYVSGPGFSHLLHEVTVRDKIAAPNKNRDVVIFFIIILFFST